MSYIHDCHVKRQLDTSVKLNQKIIISLIFHSLHLYMQKTGSGYERSRFLKSIIFKDESQKDFVETTDGIKLFIY